MNLENVSSLSLKVTPRAKKTEWAGVMDDGIYKLRVRAVPEDGKANAEILRFLREETGKEWEIVSGMMGSRKTLKNKKSSGHS